MSWKQKLSSLGYTEQNAPTSVKKAIKNFYALQKEFDSLLDRQSEDALTDNERQEIKDLLESVTKEMNKAEETISKKIDTYERNKDRYGEMAKNLKQGREKKKTNIVEEEEEEEEEEVFAPSTKKVQTQQQAQQQQQNVSDDKKKSSASWLIFGGLALVITLGAVNLFSKRD